MKQNYLILRLNRLCKAILTTTLMLLFGIHANAQLNGTYTIDAAGTTSGTNFKSFADLRTALASSSGISGPVTINVVANSGPYLENVTFPQVVGASSTNTISINGNGNTIRNTSTSAGYVIQMNGADFFTFDNLKVQAATNISGTRCFHFLNAADNNTVKNCELIVSTCTQTSASTAYVAFSASATGNSAANHGSNNTFEGNKMWNGGSSAGVGPYYGVVDFRSSSFSGTVTNNKYIGNEISNIYYYFFYNYYTNGVQMLKNKLHTNRSDARTMWISYYWYGYVSTVANKFDENEIYNLQSTGTNNGIYFYQVQGTNSLKATMNNNVLRNCSGTSLWNYRALYSNNMEMNDNQTISNSPTNYFYYGIYVGYCNNSEAKRNIISNNTALYLYGSYTIRCDNFLMEANEVKNNAASYMYYGIFFYYHTNSLCTNNAVYNNNASLIYYYMFYTGYLTNSTFAHNTLILDDDVDYYYYYPVYHYYWATPSNVKIKNNIMTFTGRSGYGYAYLMYCPYNADLITWENNVVYDNTPGTRYYNANLQQVSSFAQFATIANDKSTVEADPKFVNKSSGDIRPSNPVIANIGTPGYADKDINGKDRSTCGPDPGAVEFFTDHSVSNFTFQGSNECGGYREQIVFDFTNGTNVDMTDVKVYYAMNGGTPIIETIPSVGANKTVSYTFKSVPSFNNPGNNVIEVGLTCDDDVTNNVLKKTIFITPSPHSFSLAEGTNFAGYFKAGGSGGSMNNPDNTPEDLEIVYDIANPAKYANGDYNTSWTVTPMVYTSGGIMINDASVRSITNPSGGTMGKISFTPNADLVDSLVFVGVRAFDLNTQCDSVFGRWVYVPPIPKIDWEADNGCDGDLISFINKTAQAKGLTEYMWDFDDVNSGGEDNTSTISDPIHRFTTYGTYNVKVSAWNFSYPKFVYTLTKQVVISPVPTVCFTVKNACEGDAVSYKNCSTSPVAGTITYRWNFGDGSAISTAKDPTHKYLEAGGYPTTLTARMNGCDASLTKNANQFAMPVAAFSTSGTCNLEEIEFNNMSTISSGNTGYKWDFGDNNISNVSNPTHAFENAGTHTVKLKAISEFGCENEITKTIVLNESPKADFDYTDACNLTAIDFTRKGTLPSGNSIYQWDFDGESVSTQENPSFQFKTVGVKKVSLLISSNNGCRDIVTKEFVVKLQAKADFVAKNVCEGEEIVFTNKATVASGNLNYQWRFGDGTTSNLTSPRHGYELQNQGETESFTVTLVANVPGGCADSIAKTVTVNAMSDAKFVATTNGRNLVISDQATTDPSNSYNWRFGDGGRSNMITPTYEYKNIDKGGFNVCMSIINNAGCLSEHCEMVAVDLLSVENATNNAIKVYPNPSNGIFQIQLDHSMGDATTITVFDASGKLVRTASIAEGETMYSFDLSDASAGLYQIQISSGNTKIVERISIY